MNDSQQILGGLRIGGCFRVRCYDEQDRLLWEDVWKNAITNVGLNNVLGVQLGAVSQTTTWYMGLIDNAGFTSLNATDTMASHPNWAESTAYDAGVRQTVPFGAAASQIIGTTASCAFTMNAPTTIKGGFITSSSTKGGITGTLWATATGNLQSLVAGQVMRYDYNCSASS